MAIHPAARRLLEEDARSGRVNVHLLPIAKARATFDNNFVDVPRPQVDRVRSVRLPTRDGSSIEARLYWPRREPAAPLIVYFHGGGWVLGSIESHDLTVRHLALASGCAVLSVSYRLAPEWPFPTAVHDAVDAVLESAARAPDWGLDATRIAVAGDSAGGNLATVVAAHFRDQGGAQIKYQLLVYPITTTDIAVGFDTSYDGVVLHRDEVVWWQRNYAPDPNDARDPRVSPLLGDLTDLPPALVVLAECDPIRPQGVLYAQAMREAGVNVNIFDAAAMVHGFFGLRHIFPEGAHAMRLAGSLLADALRS